MDYRDSHKKKGEDYDSWIESSPWDAYMAMRESELLKEIVGETFNGNKIPEYLDFACGTGRVTNVVESMAQSSYGVDISETMISQAREKCTNTTFAVTDVTNEDFKEGPFNLVTAFRFFGNAQDELRVRVLEKLYELIKPGGYLIINNHRNRWAIQEILHRITGGDPRMHLSHGHLKSILNKSGFEIVSTHGIGCWVYRSGLATKEVLFSEKAQRYEKMKVRKFLLPFCPDAIIKAKRI